MQLADLTPPKVLVSRYLLEDRLSSAGSISGHQLSQAREARYGMGGGHQVGGRMNLQEELRARLSDLLLLCRDLNAEEQKVCRARYGTTAGVETKERVRRPCDVMQGDGEDIVDLKPTDPEGKVMEGFVRTRGLRCRYPSYEEIAEQFGMEPGRVRAVLDTARAKIAESIKWRSLMASQEASYE